MKKHFKFSVVSIAVSLFMANQAGAANTWTEARSDAMGGTGVAAGSYGSGVLINPSLLAKAKPDDGVTLILPSIGAQISDKDNLRDKIDNISDDVSRYRSTLDTINLIDLLNPSSQASRDVSSAAGNLADQLDSLKGKTASGKAGGGIAVSIPDDVLSFAFVAKAITACWI